MAKKNIRTRETRLRAGNDPIELKIDLEGFQSFEGELNDSLENDVLINEIIIKPVGYPIKLKEGTAPSAKHIVIDDEELFQAYSADQWNGLSVAKNEYLFDQMVIPDFAFKIIKISPPEANRININTKFVIKTIKEEKLSFDKVNFDEIIGNQQAKDKCSIIAEYIKNPEKFGEFAPKNILFYGPPGTGKTLTARAVASENDINIITQKGTQLIGLHVGDGANKIHNLFQKARENAPSIIFIDELDAIGLNRSYQNVRGDVVEVATALLAEMDGIEPNNGVITITATNTIGLLDPGLRSRFEEEIEFSLPNLDERVELLKLFFKKANLNLDINYQQISQEIDGFSGRDIKEKIVKNTVYDVIREESTKITTSHILKIIKKTKKNSNKNALYS